MFEHIKQRIVNSLIEEIECLDDIDIELVGHNVMSVMEDKRMIHHGINRNYKSCGYTVDSFSNDSSVVGEYSTEQDYFKEDDPNKLPVFQKIDKDIIHALSHNPPYGPDKIYLISSQLEKPSFRKKYNSTPLARAHGEKIIILDARELARLIYEQSIANPTWAVFYRQFFQGFSQDLDNYEYYGRIPAQCKKYFSDADALGVICRHYEHGRKICVLHGVSGSGKTQATIDFIHHKSSEFENYIWISGEDWKPGTPLSAIQRSRGGTPVNVVGLFNSAKTILVIDSLERGLETGHFEELAVGFGKGGIILGTSQISLPGSELYLPMPVLSEEVGIQIVGEDTSSASPLCRKFVNKCRFLPLILSTTREILDAGDIIRDDFYKEVLDYPELLSGPDGVSIMRRILSKLESSARDGLRKIANSGLSIHDIRFLRTFIGVNSCVNLQRVSILKPANTPGVVSVHDFICSTMEDTVSSTLLAEAIEEYIERYKGDMTPSILRQIHLGYKQIYEEHIRRGERDPDWLMYALLQIECEVKQGIQEKLHSKEITPELSLAAIMCLIDAREAHAYSIENKGERNEYFRHCAGQFDNALTGAVDDAKAELLHHRGKALRRCRNHKDALDCFTKLLVLRPGWHATHGQIAHLGMQYGASQDIKDAGEQSLRFLIDEMIQDASSVPLRVSLAALARLRSYPNIVKELSKYPGNVQKLADIIALSALDGFGQFYEAFVSFTSKFGYPHPSICVNLAERLPEMLAMPPKSVERNQWVCACEALSNTAISAAKDRKSALFDLLTIASVKFADGISSGDQLTDYDGRVVAKAYITANLPHKALDAISKVPADRINHWVLYRKAEAELMVGASDNFAEAMKTALRAIELAGKDPKATSHVSSYHKLLSDAYERLGNIQDALQEAERAVTKCTNAQFKDELARRVSYLKSMLA